VSVESSEQCQENKTLLSLSIYHTEDDSEKLHLPILTKQFDKKNSETKSKWFNFLLKKPDDLDTQYGNK